MIVFLVVVTIAYEQGVDALGENVFNEGIGAMLLSKMIRELAILGFVSFTATVLLQFVELPGGEETHESFEFSHVLMFVTACFYAIEIAVTHFML